MNKTKIFLAITAILSSGSALAVCSSADYAVTGHTYDGVTVWSDGGQVGVGQNYGDCVKITTYLPRIKDNGGWGGETNNTNGIYFAWVGSAHGNMIFGDGLWATTKGNYSDVVKTNGANDVFGGHTIVIGNNALLESEGQNASIINVAQSANSGSGYGKVIVGDMSQLIVRGTGTGTGVRVNLTSNVNKYNLAYIGKNSVIIGNGDGNNTNDSIGYGVFAGNRDSVSHNGLSNGVAKGVNAIAVIDSGATISTSGLNAHAVYANKGGTVQLYGANIAATGIGADAILAEQKSTADNNNSELGGVVNIAGNISITKANDGYAMHTIGDNSVISSSVTNYYVGTDDKLYDGAGAVVNNDAKVTQETAGIYYIEGNLFAESGLIDLRMTEDSTAGSEFIGYTKIGNDANSLENGKINLNISGSKSYWKMTDNSELTELSLMDSAILDVSDNNLTLTGQVNNTSGIIKLAGTNNANSLIIDGNYVGGPNQPTINNPLPQNNSSLIINTIWNEDPSTSYTDSLHITGSASGYTEVKTTNGIIGDIMSDVITATDKYSNSVVVVDQHTMGANSFYGFANTSGMEQAILVQKDDNNYVWKLSGSSTGTINPINPKVPEVVLMPKANLSAGYQLLGTFHERLSEQKTTENIGLVNDNGPVWGRFIGNYNTTDGQTQYDYKSKLLGFQFGYNFDTSYYEDNSIKSNFGVMFTYARDNLSFYNSKNVIFDKATGNYATDNTNTGHGQSDIYSLGSYYTYYNQNDSYLDLVGMFNYIKNKYTTYNVSNDTNHAYGIILSAEVGKSFAITNNGLNNGDWSIEPQAQLSYQYLKYSDYHTTDNLLVEQNNQQGLRGRIGGRLSYNQGNDELGIRTIYFTGNIIHDFLNQKNINFGTSDVSEKNAKTAAELGVGIQLPLTNTSYIYADTRYYHSLGNSRGKTKEFSGTLGLKYYW